jgi:hypothetical protein
MPKVGTVANTHSAITLQARRLPSLVPVQRGRETVSAKYSVHFLIDQVPIPIPVPVRVPVRVPSRVQICSIFQTSILEDEEEHVQIREAKGEKRPKLETSISQI